MNLERTHATFETTRWTLVGGLASDDAAVRRASLERLTETYWPPVYGYLRRHGKGREEAAELTQAFFADVVLWRDLFDRVDPERGRLRTLVLAALRRYLIDLARKDGRRREIGNGAGPRIDAASLSRVERDVIDSGDASPDAAFSRVWAAAVLQEARRRCEEHFLHRGKPDHWRVFEARVLQPAIAAVAPPPLAALAAELGFGSAADAAAAVQVVKKRMLAIVREIAAETASEPEDAEDEYRWLVGELA